MLKASMRVRFWGVRGSIPCPGPATIRYGGNTPCIEVRCGERVLIFDAGTGLRSLGIELLKDKKIRNVDIFITHCHLDHVSGLPFFAPFFREDYQVRSLGRESDAVEQHRTGHAKAYELTMVSRTNGDFQGGNRVPRL